MGKSVIKIGNAGGYWGDDPEALERQIFSGDLDYVTMDFLAEITMSILQKQKNRDSKLGYAKDFLPMLERVMTRAVTDNVCIITNAGGINPRGCAQEICKMAQKLGLQLRVAVVDGDDILTRIGDLESQNVSFENMETGEPFSKCREKLMSANIYFGAAPVVKALEWRPHVIVTGRVTDTGISLAPLIHEFKWNWNDWDKLAAGVVAGHILECGSQSTGGNFTDWHLIEDFSRMGYPIVEFQANGEFVVTKHQGTGGLVSCDTVREQLFYEMGNPREYITPDCIAHFDTITLSQESTHRVKVTGVRGTEPTTTYKVSMAFADGFKTTGSVVISGPEARKKAEKFAEIFWGRLDTSEIETETEYFGWNACHKSLVGSLDSNEILLRLGARSHDKASLISFGKLIPSLILSGPPGVAVTGGVAKPQEVVSYWPSLLPKSVVHPEIALFEKGEIIASMAVSETITGSYQPGQGHRQEALTPTTTVLETVQSEGSPLISICLGRSGDKGDTANIGVMARSSEAFAFLQKHLTAQVVKNYFQEFCHGPVYRYELENMLGFNFLLESALGGGGTKTLRIDAQGKTFAQALLAQKMVIPPEVLSSIKTHSP